MEIISFEREKRIRELDKEMGELIDKAFETNAEDIEVLKRLEEVENEYRELLLTV